MGYTNKVKIHTTDGSEIYGTIIGKIPGGNYFKIELDDGKKKALKAEEFERIVCKSLPFNEKEI